MHVIKIKCIMGKDMPKEERLPEFKPVNQNQNTTLIPPLAINFRKSQDS